MKTSDYYASDLVDPFGSESYDQATSSEIGYFAFEQDIVLQSIGTNKSEMNIRTFLADVLEQLDSDDKSSFLRDCFKKIIEEYNLNTLDVLFENSGILDYNQKILAVIKFFELGGWLEPIAKSLPPLTLNILRDRKSLGSFLESNYSLVKNKLSKHEAIPKTVSYYFKTASKDDCIQTLLRLLKKDREGVIASQIEKEKSHVDNKES